MNIDKVSTVLKSASAELSKAFEASPEAQPPQQSGLKELAQALLDADAAMEGGASMEQVLPQLQTVNAGLAEMCGLGEPMAEPDADEEVPEGAEPEQVLMSVKSLSLPNLFAHLNSEWDAISKAYKAGDMKQVRCRKRALQETIKSVYDASFDRPVPAVVYKDPMYKEPPKKMVSIASAAAGNGTSFVDPKGKTSRPGTSAATKPSKGAFYENASKSLAEMGATLKSSTDKLLQAIAEPGSISSPVETAPVTPIAPAAAVTESVAEPAAAEPVAVEPAVKSAHDWTSAFPS